MVREALFSILGEDVPGTLFFDVFAGTGAIGLEASSRGAKHSTFVERDFKLAAEIHWHAEQFGIANRVTVVRKDAYSWVEKLPALEERANVFVGPPYRDFMEHPEQLLLLIGDLQRKLLEGSLLIVQAEKTPFTDKLPGGGSWEVRQYGRNLLLIWLKHGEPPAACQ
jgi:16S rRNA (guanine(966)-N(2))-methyltransferase RsmD